jgi:hypothetical protein
VSEIVVRRTDGKGLPVRARRGLVEPIDARNATTRTRAAGRCRAR